MLAFHLTFLIARVPSVTTLFCDPPRRRVAFRLFAVICHQPSLVCHVGGRSSLPSFNPDRASFATVSGFPIHHDISYTLITHLTNVTSFLILAVFIYRTSFGYTLKIWLYQVHLISSFLISIVILHFRVTRVVASFQLSDSAWHLAVLLCPSEG